MTYNELEKKLFQEFKSNEWNSIDDNVKMRLEIKSAVHILDTRSNPKGKIRLLCDPPLRQLSTLFNSSKSSNFLFEVIPKVDFDPISVNLILTKQTVNSRLSELKEQGCKIIYRDIYDQVFKQNLMMIDSDLPRLLGEILLYYYSGECKSSISSILEMLEERNPMGYNFSYKHRFYEHKLKTMLTGMAFGMTATESWNGRFKAIGGVIIVKGYRESVCYHVYKMDEFHDFLLHNTKLDTPCSGRYKFGEVFESEGKYYVNLNLQIRFKV